MLAPHLKILVDENIPYALDAFAPYGEVRQLPGFAIQAQDVKDADVLLVRSVTRVDRTLLENSRVRFVGSATIGTDHIDLDYLKERGIAFAHAPGSNADSVVEYVLASLYTIAERRGESLRGRTVGIIGVGNIGSRLAERLPALGMQVLLNDPPLAEAAGQAGRPRPFVSLEELLREADILSLHVPLTKAGPHATYHLLNERTLQSLKQGAWLLNTCRGEVVDNAALAAAIKAGHVGAAALDVWENEPAPSPELMHLVDIATPHIAGYSYDGKIQGTVMIYEAFLRHFDLEPAWNPEEAFLRGGAELDLTAPDPSFTETRWLDALIRQMYGIRADDYRMRAMLDVPAADAGAYFNSLRKHYPVRRTFSRYSLPNSAIPPSCQEAMRKGLLVHLS